MSFDILIQMKLNFHKINSFFHQLISWSSLIIIQNPSIILYNVDLEKQIGEFTFTFVGRKKREKNEWGN
jgi:hypothetical protein